MRLFLPFLVSLIAGFLIRSYYPVYWCLGDGIQALGDALMVAGVVGGLIELFSAKVLIEKVSDDLAQRLVGRGLPKELQAHIHEITKTKFVRSNYVKRYRLSLSDTSEKMILDMESSFEVRNYSDVPEAYCPVSMEEAFYSPEFIRIEYGLQGDQPRVYDGTKLQGKVEDSKDGRVKSVVGLEEIKISPVTEEKFARVTVRHSVTMPLEYTEITYFGGATTDVTLVCQEIPEGFEFSGAGDDAIHTLSSNSWAFKGPYVAGQHVRVRWFKKPQISK